MTLKTVNRYCGIAMTALAEIFIISRDTPGSLAGMAIDAGFQTVLSGAYACAQAVVALVLKQIHMIQPHKHGITDALDATRGFDYRL